jgi:hypothetical protein
MKLPASMAGSRSQVLAAVMELCAKLPGDLPRTAAYGPVNLRGVTACSLGGATVAASKASHSRGRRRSGPLQPPGKGDILPDRCRDDDGYPACALWYRRIPVPAYASTRRQPLKAPAIALDPPKAPVEEAVESRATSPIAYRGEAASPFGQISESRSPPSC